MGATAKRAASASELLPKAENVSTMEVVAQSFGLMPMRRITIFCYLFLQSSILLACQILIERQRLDDEAACEILLLLVQHISSWHSLVIAAEKENSQFQTLAADLVFSSQVKVLSISSTQTGDIGVNGCENRFPS